MSLVNAGLVSGATSLSVTGGSAVTFAEKVRDRTNLVIQVLADSFSVRRKIAFNFREAKPKTPILNGASSSYSQQRAQATLTLPVTITDPVSSASRTEYNTITIIASQHPLTSAANKQELRFLGAQLLFDADTTAFFDDGNLG